MLFQHNDLTAPFIVLMEDDLIHTETRPFCAFDPTCGCHRDDELLTEVAEAIDDGLLTSEEATRYVVGQMF